MASFPRGVLLFLLLLVGELLPCSSAATLDAEEMQKENEARESAVAGDSRGAADGAPDPPVNLRVFPTSDTIVQLIWDPPSDTTDVDHYYVYVEGEDMDDMTDATVYIFTNLVACTNYTFGVQSVSAADVMSDPLLGDGTTDVGVPPPPRRLQVDDYTATTVTLSWEEPGTLCDVEEYRVKWSDNGIDTQSSKGTETSFTVTDLSKNTTYKFDVSGFTSAGEGDVATVQQTTAVDDGGPPEDLVAVGLSNSVISVSWSPPSYEPKYYVVVVLGCKYLEDLVFGLSYNITGLTDCDTCDVTVTSYYSQTTQYSADVLGNSLSGDPPPPTGCSVTAAEERVTVTWTKPNTDCFLGSYSVNYTWTKLWGDGGEGSGGEITAASDYTVQYPVSYSTYSFNISSSIDGVYGSPASCSGTSLETLPGAPVILNVDFEEGKALVTWKAPAEENGIIVNYEIYVDEKSEGTVEGDVFSASVNLEPCKSVGLSVRARNAAGWGPLSDVETVTVIDDVLPKTVNCAASDLQVEVCWEPYSPTCPVSQYNLEWEGDVLWDEDLVDSNSTTMEWSNVTICYNVSALPYTEYYVELSVGIKPDTISCSDITLMAAPGPPTNVDLKAEDFAINVTWAAPVEKNGIIDFYQVEWTPSVGDPGSKTTKDNTTFSLETSSLSCGTVVDVTVRAKVTDVNEFGEKSPPQTAYVVNSVDTLNCRPSSSREVSLNWTLEDPDCPVGFYNVTWTYESLWSDDTGQGSMIVENADSATVDSLFPYSSVVLQIHVDNNPEFTDCTAITLEEVPGKPVIVNVDSEEGKALVTWKAPADENGVIVNYEIYVDGKSEGTVEGDVFSASVNVEPCKSVGLSVRARNGAGWGPLSDVETVTVVDDVLPKTVNCSASDLQVEVCWEPYSPTCPVSQYNLEWEGDVLWDEDLVDSNSTTMEWSNATTCYNVSALPYTEYYVELSVGIKPDTISCSDITPMAAPGPPTNVDLKAEDLAINVTWVAPVEKNGIIDFYQVEWTPSDGEAGSQTTDDNTTFSLETSSLSCGTVVDVTVRAKVTEVNEFGEKSPPQTAYVVNSVDTLDCWSSSSREVSLNGTLEDPDCPVGFYNVTWTYESLWSDDTGQGWEKVENAESATVDSLFPYSSVVLQIHVDNDPEFTDCTAITLEEVSSPPTDFRQVDNDTSSVTVQWGLPVYIRGKLTGWHLTWTALDSTRIGESNITEAEDMTYKINDLSSSSTYFVYVMALNGAGESPPANVSAKTMYVPPSKSNTGLIIGLSVGGGILLIILLVGGFILYRKQRSAKPPRSAPHMPEVTDADSHGEFGRRPSQQIDIGRPNLREYGRRPSQQAGLGRPNLSEYGRRSSQQVELGRPNLGEYGRRPSQQVDLGRPNLSEYGRRPSQQADLGRPNLSEYGRRPSQQADLGKPRLGEYGRRPSQQVDLGRPRLAEYGRRASQQVDLGRTVSSEYARRPSQQLPSGSGSYPARLPHEGVPRRSSVDLHSRRSSQQTDIGRPGDRMFMKRPSQQFVMKFDEIQEL